MQCLVDASSSCCAPFTSTMNVRRARVDQSTRHVSPRRKYAKFHEKKGNDLTLFFREKKTAVDVFTRETRLLVYFFFKKYGHVRCHPTGWRRRRKVLDSARSREMELQHAQNTRKLLQQSNGGVLQTPVKHDQGRMEFEGSCVELSIHAGKQ